MSRIYSTQYNASYSWMSKFSTRMVTRIGWASRRWTLLQRRQNALCAEQPSASEQSVGTANIPKCLNWGAVEMLHCELGKTEGRVEKNCKGLFVGFGGRTAVQAAK
jgi:hypothetical protein